MTATVMMRIREDTHGALRELAQEENTTLQEVLAKAIDLYRRTGFCEQMNAAYAALRADPEAWQQELEDRAAWDVTLLDGIEPETFESHVAN
jgi:hypothetical protein